MALAQNLVADSSFEKNKFIPTTYSAIDASYSWSSPSRGTTDLFCTCNKKDIKISRVNQRYEFLISILLFQCNINKLKLTEHVLCDRVHKGIF